MIALIYIENYLIICWVETRIVSINKHDKKRVITLKVNLLGSSVSEIEAVLGQFDVSQYRTKQTFRSIYRNRVNSIDEISVLSLDLRAKLKGIADVRLPSIIEVECADDDTQKILFQTEGNSRVEAVIIKDDDRLTGCLSSQVGCVVGCKFCSTGGIGFQRNLNAGEILGQYFEMEKSAGKKLNNIVFMGMGEPLLNRQEVFKAIELLTDPKGIGFPQRKITISTFGLIPGIEAMIKSNLKVNFAVSLSATTEEQRQILIPTYRKYTIKKIIKAANKFALSSGDRVSINYLLLNNVNDSDADAERLSELLRGLRSKVNIMEFNGGYGKFSRSDNFQVDQFVNTLLKNRVKVTRRTSKGADIGAACGQLAAGYAAKIQEVPDTVPVD